MSWCYIKSDVIQVNTEFWYKIQTQAKKNNRMCTCILHNNITISVVITGWKTFSR